MAGPLANISQGGLALRVDRALKLDDGIRIPASTVIFERGRSFPRIRIQDLPRLPLLELPGRVTHATEHGSEILLGMDFGELSEDQRRILGDCLRFREMMFQAKGGGFAPERPPAPSLQPEPSKPAAAGVAEPSVSIPGEDAESSPGAGTNGLGGEATTDPMLLLRRKVIRLVLVSGGKGLTERFRESLWTHGYQRVEVVPDFPEAQTAWRQDGGRARPRLLLADLSLVQVGDMEPLGAVRHLERQAETLGDIPLAILCEDLDPTMLLEQASRTRFLSIGNGEESWIESLDSLLGIGAEEA